MLAEALWTQGKTAAEGWNFGPEDTDVRPVSSIVETLVSGWNRPTEWSIDSDPQPHEAHYLKLDISKAKSQLKWRPVLGISDALEWILRWNRQMPEVGAKAATLSDIQTYQRIVTCQTN
jgi:CDP-glucose 4,6-dehydratase